MVVRGFALAYFSVFEDFIESSHFKVIKLCPSLFGNLYFTVATNIAIED